MTQDTNQHADPTPIPNPIDQIIANIATAMHEWSEKQVTDLKKKVFDRLDKHQEEVLLKLMGFDNRWGSSWNIDHCNGRNGNSPIGDFLKDTQEEAIKEWLSQIKMPAMSPKFKKNIEKDLRATYEQHFRQRSYEIARAKANEDLDDMLEHVLKPTILDQYLRMQALVAPPTPLTPTTT